VEVETEQVFDTGEAAGMISVLSLDSRDIRATVDDAARQTGAQAASESTLAQPG
jgi:hypothetical protein